MISLIFSLSESFMKIATIYGIFLWKEIKLEGYKEWFILRVREDGD